MSEPKNYDFRRRLGVDMSSAKPVQGSQTEFTAHCPFCHNDRKTIHQKQREFWFDTATGHYKCHNCGKEGRLDSEQWIAYKERQKDIPTGVYKGQSYIDYTRVDDLPPAGPNNGTKTINAKTAMTQTPQDWKYFHEASMSISSDEVHNYLGSRKIDLETRRLLKIGGDRQRVPGTQEDDDCVVFNYYLDGKLVNQKYRFIKEKNFIQTPNCLQVPYNIDSLKCDKDENGQRPEVIIVEGEMDVASMVAANFDRVISIPNGAKSNLDWVEKFWSTHFEGVKQYIIAVDMDKPGMELAQRLAERFGPVICRRVDFGADCKDANEYLCRFDELQLRELVNRAPMYPLPGIVHPDDIYQEFENVFNEGASSGYETGWVRHFDKKLNSMTARSIDNFVTWETKQLALITGRSGDGKSEWLDELVVRLNLKTGWKAAYFTPENSPIYHHESKILEKVIGKRFPQKKRKEDIAYISKDEFIQGANYIRENYQYINPPVNDMKIDVILKSADYVVQRYGIKILVLDPYNYIEKEMEREWQLNQWDSQTISKIRDFAVSRNLLCFLIAHPRKVYESDKDGNRRRIEMSDISGTADFGNKADYCIVVDRNKENDMTTVFIDKVRNKDLGDRGICFFVYTKQSGRFLPCEKLPTNKESQEFRNQIGQIPGDTTNWLETPPFGVEEKKHEETESKVETEKTDDEPETNADPPF